MPETIESFVAKLQVDGVQAGQEQAAKLRAEAQAEAKKIIAEANARAGKIIAEAEAQAQAALARGQTELELAARDAGLRLRDALSHALETVLKRGATETLSDRTFLGKLLHEIVLLYARQLREGKEVLTINVPPDQREALIDWAIAKAGQSDAEGLGEHLSLTNTLAQAGFEYNVSGAHVEVTVESVVQTLLELLSPRLGEILQEAMAQKDS